MTAAITTLEPRNLRTIATGLRFPEGPIAMEDGSVLVVEIAAGRITRVRPDGSTEPVAEPGGGPNGIAFGADGALWVTNNGGCFDWHERMGLLFPSSPPPSTYPGNGALQRIDLSTGDMTTVVEEVGGNPLKAPNDLVVGADGGIWFTDHGTGTARSSERTGAYWCAPDGTEVREVVHALAAPNGIGLSPGGDRLYVAETYSGRLYEWPVVGPGELGGDDPFGPSGGSLLGDPDGHLYDSLAVDGDGWICVATLGKHAGITAFSPDGSAIEHIPMLDPLTTNICFAPAVGGSGATAYVTLSGTGQLVAFDWHRPPGPLRFRA